MKKLVIFDLDGTLLNTIADLAEATNQALEKLNFPTHSQEAYFHFVGNGIAKLFERALPPTVRTSRNIQKMRELFVPYYDKHNIDQTAPYKGIKPLLRKLSERKIKLAVASNKYQIATEKLIAHYFPEIPFVAICGQQEGIPTKPNPLLIQHIINQANVTTSDTLYVGDSDVDMQTAQNAGVESCGVLWGFRSREELAAYHPILLAEKPEDILRIL